MNSLKLFLTSFRKDFFSYILVALEIAALILTENYIFSILKEREILNVPFTPLLNDNSVYFYDMNKLYAVGSREELSQNVSGEYKVYDIKSCSVNSVVVISVSDEIYDKLSLPLKFGNYAKAVASERISKGENNIQFSDGQTLTLNVSGTLTEMTYLPSMESFSTDMTTSDFYINSANTQDVIITNRSSINGYEKYFINSTGFIIEFNENAEENISRLRNSRAIVIDSDLIIKNSEKALNYDRERFLPIIITVTLIVLVGTICISVITFKENELKNGIMWLCGYSRAGIIGMHITNISLISLFSVIISAVAFLILKLSENEFVTGLNLSLGNLILTAITVLLLIGISTVIPAIKSKNTSPVEYLRRAK